MPFLVSLELRHSDVTELADVVFPVAAVMEKAGTFVDWEGRERPFEQALPPSTTMTDLRVLHSLAAEMGVALGLPGIGGGPRRAAQRSPSAVRPAVPAPAITAERPRVSVPARRCSPPGRWLLDDGRMQDGEPHLAGTRKLPRLHLSEATAAALGVGPGDLVSVGPSDAAAGAITLPLVVADLPDGVVWLPTSSPGSHVREQLGAAHGDVVTVAPARQLAAQHSAQEVSS